jgi:signal transduction histidine kinase
MVRTDGIRLAQIFINLISNAIKYTMKGEVCVETKLNKNNNTMITVVRDTGVGMAKE